MQIIAQIALYAWIPIVLFMFRDLGGHRALITAYVGAWLFLPKLAIPMQGLPDFSKVSATSLAIGLATLMFEPWRYLKFRLKWYDVPVLVFCLCPIPSALHNQLGLWDGISNVMKVTLMWGVPYLFGRMYLTHFEKVRDLARGIFIGGLLYVPFCLVEMRMSPQFNNWVYGITNLTSMAKRYGGWRPIVFLETGLELGMWMTAASLMGFVLWYAGDRRRVFGFSMGWMVLLLLGVTVLCKSTGSLMLLAGGIALAYLMTRMRRSWLALLVAVVPLVYMGIRITNIDDGSALVQMASKTFGGDRAQSLEFRFRNENLLVARAWQNPVFGWGGWGRERVRDETGKGITIVDGFWIVLFGQRGLIGMSSFFVMFLLAPMITCFRFVRRPWKFHDTCGVLGLALFLLLYTVDCLLNAMENALYPLALGGIATLMAAPTWQLLAGTAATAETSPATSERPARRRLWPPRPHDEPIPSTDLIS